MLLVHEGVRDESCSIVQLEGEEVAVHVWLECRGTDEAVETQAIGQSAAKSK